MSLLKPSRIRRNVFDPLFMRKIKKTYAQYRDAMNDQTTNVMSRQPFVDIDDKGPAWFLGHMNTASQEIERKICNMDFILELRDARLPFTTQNPYIERLTKDVPRLIIFNKAELSNEGCNRRIQDYYENKGQYTLFTSVKSTWRDTVESVQKLVTHVLPPKAFRTTAYCGCVVGMPNVGKSTLINSLRLAHEYQFHRDDFRRSRAPETVSVVPGTTRNVKLVPISRDPHVVLYDTPGLTMPGCFNREAGLKLAACGIVPTNSTTLTAGLVARYIYNILNCASAIEHAAECLRLPRTPVSFEDCTSLLCERSSFSAQTLMRAPHAFIAHQFLVNDFQSGRLGRITLDRLPKVVSSSTAKQLGQGDSDARGEDDEGATSKESGESAVPYTHHVTSKDVVRRYPEYMNSVMGALEKPEAVISRKRGPIADPQYDAFLSCTRLRRKSPEAPKDTGAQT